ncbi:BLOC-1-related complex subunit 5 [Aphelenchoides besseyi]|nr:BLOC-1-related complex subunit 5 [Aphelenchoides besseyi]KAI6194443.1 BLOC-1-related complex subunit 5 [Aphelenchoides besseyi]
MRRKKNDEISLELFPASEIAQFIPDSSGEFVYRPLRLGDFNRGYVIELFLYDFTLSYLELLSDLTTVGHVSKEAFRARFESMTVKPQAYFIVVVEDTKVEIYPRSCGASQKTHSPVVVANTRRTDPNEDENLKKLREIPRFQPLLRGVLPGQRDQPSIFSKIDPKYISRFIHRLQIHFTACQQTINAEQTKLNAKITELSLEEVTSGLQILNELLPENERLPSLPQFRAPKTKQIDS